MGLDVSERDHKFRGEGRRNEQSTLLVKIDGVTHLVDLEKDSTERLEEFARSLGVELVSLRNNPDLRLDRELSKRESVFTAYYHRINEEVVARRRMSRNEASRTWLLRFFRTVSEMLPPEQLRAILAKTK